MAAAQALQLMAGRDQFCSPPQSVLSSRMPPRDSPSLQTDGKIVRRVVNADNSCLFNSVGYVLEGHSRQKAASLRQLIADTVTQDTKRYNAVFLGKSPNEYKTWILKDESWGGAIELSILARFYQTEIAVVDVQSLRTDVYGQEEGYLQRVYLIYDGIHYDPLALTFDDGLPEDADVTVFNPVDEYVSGKALELARQMNQKNKFTDTSKYSLRCLVCGEGLEGNSGAVAVRSCSCFR